MKKYFKKVATVLGTALMLGSTIAMGAAASYPAPFVQSGAANVAIVVGANAALSDGVAASAISADLATELAAQTASAGTTTAVVSGGDAASLASGSDLLYLNDDLAENVQTLTKDDLSMVLEDGTFTDDGGTDYEFEQTVVVGTSATNGFAFSNSDNDLDDPALILALSTNTANPIYNWTATFDDPVNFTASDSEGEEISLFGKTYTVGTATDTTKIVLLGGSATERVEVGETKTLTVGTDSYEVVLNAISDATSAVASITVNGETKTFTEGQTKEIDGNDVYVKTVFRTGDNAGYVEIQLGADKLTLTSGSSVQTGSDDEDIDGTLVTLTGGTTALTKLEIAVVADDSDVNHVAVGESFTDTVFGTMKLNFADVKNGPSIEGNADASTTRKAISIKKGGDRELMVEFTDAAGNKKTVPFTYEGALADDNSNSIHIKEGTTMDDDDYFILNSGNYQHLMQLTKVDADSSGQVTFENVMTGDDFGTDSGTNHTATQTVYILGQAYTITRVSDTSVTITTSDYSTNVAVYPYIELVNGEDTRMALTDEVAIGDAITTVADGTAVSGKIYELPTGTLQFRVADSDVAGDGTQTSDYRVDGGSWTNVAAANGNGADEFAVTVGTVVYVVDATISGEAAGAAVWTIDNIAVDGGQDAGDVDDELTTPSILFVEEEDKSEASSDVKNAVILGTTDSGTYSTSSTPVFAGAASDTATFDESDYVGYLTNFGTYVLKDSSDDNQVFTSLTFPAKQMYADVYLAEIAASIEGGSSSGGSATSLGAVTVTDAEAASVASKNLIVVGGSCINSVAASLLGGAACGGDFTTKTTVKAGEALIKSFDRSGKVALLVAGFNAEDTTKAATYLTNNAVNTSVGAALKVTSATSATAITA